MSTNRENDLVLAPNEYAFISDQTKGHVIAYVGPYKTSMANTDKPVVFDRETKRFHICSLEESIQSFITSPEGWYIILKNPSSTGEQPKTGTSNNLTHLNIGRKVNIPGPCFFALWPGQMAKVVPGHHLRSNQYLVVRVYEEEQARKNWSKAVIKPQKNAADGETTVDDSSQEEADTPALTMGQLIVIKGTKISFYIPPTGIEVVPDDDGEYVREAVTLQRLEYCILLDENGNKRYIKGPAVVFPKPTETFVMRNSERKFRAIELSETSGIHIKVIAPYEDEGKQFQIGEELFITGNDLKIYYPRPEHALIKSGTNDIYTAVAIPPGEGRYFLNRKSGKISLMRGPAMFLPDPREMILVRRVLSPKQASLMYPGNREVLEYNQRLKEIAEQEKGDLSTITQNNFITNEKLMLKQQYTGGSLIGDQFTRKADFSQSPTITLDTKYEGAVTVDVWPGYATLVLSKTGDRKVIVGPKTYLLEYDETLGVMELSKGKPKADDNLLQTVYLRVQNNKVSDIVYAETKDLVKLTINLKYRMNFTGEPEKWFAVENYVKFLTDHMRSVIRNSVQRYTITEFYENGISTVRDIILGAPSEEKERTGRMFKENGMHIYDVEVLDIKLEDPSIEKLLLNAQHETLKQRLELVNRENTLEFIKKTENIEQEVASIKSSTKLNSYAIYMSELDKQLASSLLKLSSDAQTQQKSLENKAAEQEMLSKINEIEMAVKRRFQEFQFEVSDKALAQKLTEIKAEVDAVVQKASAVSPDLIAALQAFGDKALAEKMAESMAPLSIIGGKSIAEVFGNMLRGTTLENVLKLNKGSDQK